MAQTITYYAIIDEFSSRDRPGGVLRRVIDDNGQVDEAFSTRLDLGILVPPLRR